MQDKFERIFHLAVCIGCPFVKDVAGALMCKKYKNNGFLQRIEDVDSETCDKLSQAPVNQLKLSHPRVGLGFLIEPCEDDPGDVYVILLGSIGVIFKSKLSEMFPNEEFAVFPSLRIFTEGGQDQTKIIREKILNKALESAPEPVTDPYASLLNEDAGAPAQITEAPSKDRTYKVMSTDDFAKSVRSRAVSAWGQEDDGSKDIAFIIYQGGPSRLGRSDDWDINFSFENFTCFSGEFRDNGGELMGTQRLDDFVFLGCLAGGDWEVPVFFISYFAGDGLPRAYVPKKGNVLCKEHKCAYGSCTDHVNNPEDACPVELHEHDKYNWDALRTDIEETFDLKPQVPKEE